MEQEQTVRPIGEVLGLLNDCGFEPHVLYGDDKNRVVIVTPSLVGRVLCTGFDGIEGDTDSYISTSQIRHGLTHSQPRGNWAAVGGEERIWFAPENGPYGFFMPAGTRQTFDDYLVPEPMNSTCFQMVGQPQNQNSLTFAAQMTLVNYQGAEFRFEVTRQVRVLDYSPYCLSQPSEVELTGFETFTWVKNTGPHAWTKDTGCVSIWTLGQFLCHDHTIVILPFRGGTSAEFGESVSTEYFRLLSDDGNPPPANSWSVQSDHALLQANGAIQTKLEVLGPRSVGRLAGIDLSAGTMSIVDFDVYPQLEYAASFPPPYDGDAYAGGACSSFVLSKSSGVPPFYELECCSPALLLASGDQFCHRSRTFRLRGSPAALGNICEKHFFVNTDQLRAFDAKNP